MDPTESDDVACIQPSDFWPESGVNVRSTNG